MKKLVFMAIAASVAILSITGCPPAKTGASASPSAAASPATGGAGG